MSNRLREVVDFKILQHLLFLSWAAMVQVILAYMMGASNADFKLALSVDQY